MHFLRTLILVSLVLTGCARSNQPAAKAEKPVTKANPDARKKHPLDKSEYHRFVMENGLRVLTVSDPRFNKSSASMLVEVGSLDNPVERQGLAHFLEHMLFLGTEKYPGVDDYGTFVTENGGYDNAYTSSDHTNYYFEINHGAFKGALDRFSQFFVAPLFTQEYTEREMNAVNSEHQKNLENDSRRLSHIQRLFFREGHPERKFSTGSLETLKGITREELVSFYESYYSSDRMVLVLLGKASTDSLQTWAQRYFSGIVDRDLTKPTYPADYLPSLEAVRTLKIDPIKDIRTMEMMFDLPAYTQLLRSKPVELIASLVGHEGEGSLLSLLKKRNLASALIARHYHSTDSYGALEIEVEMTPEGLEAYREVIRLCMAYIDILKKSPYPAYHFEEERKMAGLDEIYSDRGEGGGYSTSLARNISRYSLDIGERVSFLYGEGDPDAYFSILSHLTPDNMLVTMSAKDVPTTDTEHHYQAKYGFTEDQELYATLQTIEPVEELRPPDPNPFIPTTTQMPDRPQASDIVPMQILNEPGVRLYHALDQEFLRPKVSLRYKLRFPADRMSLRFKVLLDTYTSCVNESLNELAYPAQLAGLDYNFANGYEGVYFQINGYDESASRLFDSFLSHMQDLGVSERRFAILKEGALREIRNFAKQDAWRITMTRKDALLYAVNFTPEERLTVLEGLTLQEVRTFASTLYDRIHIEALVYGNLPADEAVALTRRMQTSLGSTPIGVSTTFTQTSLKQPAPESIRQVANLDVNNSCFWREYLLGPTSPETQAITSMIALALEQPFYTEMRTNQQLGYIVWSGNFRRRVQTYLYYIIQSGDYPADEVERRADAQIATYPDLFREMDDETFDGIRAAAIEEIRQRAKTISERANELNEQAYVKSGDFAYEAKTIAALNALTRDRVASVLEATLSVDSRRMRTVLSFAREHEPAGEIQDTVDDIAGWKASRQY